MEDEARAAHEDRLEAVRAGVIYAHDQKQYERYIANRPTRPGGPSRPRGLTGEALERAVMGVAARHPEYVVMGGPA